MHNKVLVSIVFADALVLKHHAISNQNPDWVLIYSEHEALRIKTLFQRKKKISAAFNWHSEMILLSDL